jgi:acetoacetate decarboxylase
MTIDEVKPRAFAMQLLAAQSVADLTLGLGKVVYVHLQS